MGQLASKRKQNVQQVTPGEINGESLPDYYSRRVDNNGQLENSLDGVSEINIPPPPTITIDSSGPDGERSDSVVETRRSSIYSALDAVPQLDFYSNGNSLKLRPPRKRPSLDLLRKPFEDGELSVPGSGVARLSDLNSTLGDPPDFKEKQPVRFGWIIGVMIRCMLNIWGVILFLRLSWITSQAGLLLTWLIILMSVVVTTVTALSVSAISTNGRVSSGGAYFMISRTLGPEMGGPIGMVFSFANALACALNTVGFAEVVRDLLEEMDSLMVDRTNDVRIIGVITISALLLVSLGGMEWEEKTQLLFFAVLMVAFVNYFVGTVIPVTPEKQAIGVFSYRSEIFLDNLLPSWRGVEGEFFKMFAIFFPSAIGILSGVNICGDLKDPATAIPKGTLMAIFWTTISYLVISATVAACMVRDASGNVMDMLPANHSTDDCVGLPCQLGWNFTECIETQSCKYGLANNFKALSQVSGYGYLITAGVFAASLSSALAFLVSAPKVFQCLCRDKIYPYIIFFAKGYGKNDEPLRAYLLCYFIAVAFILIAELNFIAALISNFFLCSYALINFSCFHASITNSPGWRPSFRYYSRWAALFGAVISVVLMFMLTWWAALATFCIILFLFGYVRYTKPKCNWGSSVQAGTYNMALSYSVSLSGVEDHVKNFRPQCLVLTGPPNLRPSLVDFVGSFTKNVSLMICGDIIMEEDRPNLSAHRPDGLVKWLNKRKVRSFYTPFTGDSLRGGTRHLLQASGLGKLKPNTLIMGFKNNWKECPPSSLVDYVNTINDTFDSNYGVCLLRMMDGLDISDELECQVNMGYEPDDFNESAENVERDDDIDAETSGEEIAHSEHSQTVFQNHQRKKTIDVYWISDDGGLTLLVPYLLTRRKRWRQCKVRVFVIGDQVTMEEERREMTSLLKRFRLDIHDVIVVTDSEKPPHPKNLRRFEESVAPFRLREEEQGDISVQQQRERSSRTISDKELEALRQKSERKVRLNEIIRRNSKHAALVLVSLPVPQSDCPSALYMAWLEALSCGLHCPAVLIRGNQQNVLTFYCQ
ncbi:solute carrier family 12 member 3-like [Aplochiton taeniatus]